MDKFTPQEFALYIGQDIQYPDIDGTLITATLTGVNTYEGLETTYKNCREEDIAGDILAFRSNGNHNSDALHVKLLLRPLSDITEEEAKEVWAELGFNSDYKFIREDIVGGHVGLSLNLIGIYFTEMTKRGFCLFPEWFEQGKAIDKTKEVQNG